MASAAIPSPSEFLDQQASGQAPVQAVPRVFTDDSWDHQRRAIARATPPTARVSRLREFDQARGQWNTLHDQAEQEQHRIDQAQLASDPGRTPDGATFTHPWTGLTATMDPAARGALASQIGAAQQKVDQFRAKALQIERANSITPQPSVPQSPSEFLATLPEAGPGDPLRESPKRPEDLPPQEHFDQAHHTAVGDFMRSLFGKTPPVAKRAEPLNNAAAAALDTANENGLLRLGQNALRPPTQYAEPEPTTTAGRIAKGIGSGVANIAEGMTTPKNLALIGATEGLGVFAGLLPKIGTYLPRAVSAYFSADMLHSAYEQYPRVKAAIDSGDSQAAAREITKIAGTVGLAALAGAHAARGAPGEPAGAPRETEPTPRSPGDRAVASAQAGAQALGPSEPSAGAERAGREGVPSPSAFLDQEETRPARRVTGSIDVPLNDRGRAQAADLAARTRGQFDAVNTSPMARAAETAAAIAPNPNVSPDLGPMRLGDHEGKPEEAERSFIHERMRTDPDEPFPMASGRPSESTDAFTDRVISQAQDQLTRAAQTGAKILNVTHGRNMRALEAWAKNGMPADRSVDTKELTADGDHWSEPGDVYQLTPDGMKKVEGAPAEPGAYFVRHGETDFSAPPTPNASTNAQAEQPASEPLAWRETLKPDIYGTLAPGARRVLPDGRVEVLERVPMEQIRPAQPTDTRPQGNEIYPDVLDRYVRAHAPVELRPDEAGGFTTHEGHHRIEAARLRGQSDILAWTPQETAMAESPGAPLTLREPSAESAYGREASIAVPGDQTRYPARYAIRELSDVHPSHNPHSFEPNPRYEYTNDRDYSRSGNASRVVKQASAGVFDPEFLTTDSPTAEHGTPIIDANGNTLSGNSRAMTLARVYARGGGDAERYRESVEQKAQQFGIAPEALGRFKQPVLVREVAGGLDAQKAITDFNKAAAADLTPEERAVSDGRRLSPSTVSEIASRIEDQGEDGSLADALRGDDGAQVINRLVRDGVITDQEKGGYLDDRGQLTPEAKARIAKALVGRLFDSPAEYREMTPELRGKLERVAPQVLRVEGRPDWSLTEPLRQGLALLGDAKAHRSRIEDVARQNVFGGARSYSPEAVAIARTLDQSPLRAAAAFRRYANDETLSRDGAQSSFFTPPSRAEAFRDAFESGPTGGGLRELAGALADTRGGVDPNLASLGAKRFFERDVAPTVKRIASDLVEAKDQILKVVAPQLRGFAAELTALSLRDRMAQFARRYDQGEARLRDAERFFNGRSPEENYKFIDDIERGRSSKDSHLDQIAGIFRQMLDQRRREVQALGEGALERFYANYFPHIFERPEQAERFFESFFGDRRRMEGPKSFLKHREFPTFSEAREAGMKPVSDNPVRMVMMKVREMDRYLLAHDVLRDMAERGIAKRVSADETEGGQGTLPGIPLEEFHKKDWSVARREDLPADFKSIRDPVGGGKWYAQEGAADVLNNYLSPGLRSKSGIFRTLLGVNNTMNQANLGLSAFHLTGEVIRSAVSRAALGIEDALNGRPIRGAVKISTSAAAPFLDYVRGDRVLREWFAPGKQGAPIAAIVDGLVKGGGRVRQDAAYSNEMAAKMAKAFREGNYPGALLRAPFAALEKVSAPMMEHLIPRLKLGAFSGMAANELERLGPGAKVEDVQRAMSAAWDSIDNRFGQLVYDNLFWDRTFKDVMHLGVRSIGWNLGTLREIGGGLKDLAALSVGRKPEFNHRLAYTLALPMISGMIGAVYQYLHTGRGPRELTDYFFPKREEGSRIALPTDVKDIRHYAVDPVRTIENKTSPLVSTTVDMLHNRDFYDRPIRNEDDPLVKQLGQELNFLGRQTLPFTLQPHVGKKVAPDANPEHQVENFLGFTRAPAALQPGYKPRNRKSTY